MYLSCMLKIFYYSTFRFYCNFFYISGKGHWQTEWLKCKAGIQEEKEKSICQVDHELITLWVGRCVFSYAWLCRPKQSPITFGALCKLYMELKNSRYVPDEIRENLRLWVRCIRKKGGHSEGCGTVHETQKNSWILGLSPSTGNMERYVRENI